MKQCKCESWCYCIRESIQKEIDKINFVDSKHAINVLIKYFKLTNAGKYDVNIDKFVHMYEE